MRDSIWTTLAWTGCVWFTLLAATSLPAAEPEFVGVLALALEDEVAEKIGLSESVREKLLEVVDRRETEALEIALELRDLPFQQRAVRLAPFRAESERQGLRFLSQQQRALLRAEQVARMGMASLAEPDVVAGLGLSPAQQEEIGRLLQERAQAVIRGDRSAQQRTRASYDRKLAALLTEEQRVRWDQIAAGTPAVDKREPPYDAPETAAAAPSDPVPGGDHVGVATDVDGNTRAAGDVRLQFNFRYAPWKDVLDWFAIQADLSLVTDAPPLGTFNYTDNRRYTPAEAIDLLNSVLLTKGYTLVRRGRMLILVNLEDGIPQNLVSQVSPDELDQRGEYELVSCLFPLAWLPPEDAEKEISKLLGPQGSVVTLPMARQILVTETAGKLRTIRKVLDAVENQDSGEGGAGDTTAFPLKHVGVQDVIDAAQQLFGLPDDENATPDGSLRIAPAPLGSQLLAAGEPRMLNRLRKLIQLLDVPSSAGSVIEFPQLEVYRISTADPSSVLQVVQTLLAGAPDVRAATDPKTGNLVALARPSQHATIRATIDQMERDALQVEVIQLSRVDPQMAVMSINKLFGADGESEITNSMAPRVDSDPTTRSLLVRGTQSQIAQIRGLLEKMGETDEQANRIRAGQRGNVRMLPLTGFGARRALEQARVIWPTMRPNRIRTVTPSDAIRTIRPGSDEAMSPSPRGDAPPGTSREEETGNQNEDTDRRGRDPDPLDHDGNGVWKHPAIGASSSRPADEAPTATFTAEPTAGPADPDQARTEPSDILVTPGPRGLMIASKDLEALDEFEGLLRTLADRMISGQNELAVFYLKYAKADVAAELLKRFLGAGGGGDGAGGGSLLGDLAGAALGESGGGLLGSLLGLGGASGGRVATRSAATIMADPRLNAVIVQTSSEELDLAEQLLKVIDQNQGPEEVQTIARPRLIPVFNMRAEELATIVRETYATRVTGGAAGGAPRQPTPEEFIRAMRGGGSDRPSVQEAVQEQQRMTISADSRSNSLIVTAPDPLFLEVQDLVKQLDQAPSASNDTMRVVTIRRSNPEMIQRALAAMLGDAVRTGADRDGRVERGPPSARDLREGPPDGGPTPEQVRDQMRRRIEFFNALQRMGQQGMRRPGDERSRAEQRRPGGRRPGG